jgi:hypothetical protein
MLRPNGYRKKGALEVSAKPHEKPISPDTLALYPTMKHAHSVKAEGQWAPQQEGGAQAAENTTLKIVKEAVSDWLASLWDRL